MIESKRLIISCLVNFYVLFVCGQQSMGGCGLIHVPTADMDTVGMARVGAQFLPKEMTPVNFCLDGAKYNTASNYLCITPFRWIAISYGYTLMKFHKNLDPNRETGFYAKDRYFSAKLQLLCEEKWWPSFVIGGNDLIGTDDGGESKSNYYRNFFVAISKHFEYSGHLLGAHLTYRKWYREQNRKWNGVVGGITYQPSFYHPLRAVVEWDGNGVNCGVDCRIYRYFLVQLACYEGKAITGGLCLCFNLI